MLIVSFQKQQQCYTPPIIFTNLIETGVGRIQVFLNKDELQIFKIYILYIHPDYQYGKLFFYSMCIFYFSRCFNFRTFSKEGLLFKVTFHE